ncbi:glutamate-5-semialdehyde dehydrogenase [Cerasicoccus frondis]|uniref:glutamate-5-semialdehyde dehydrogenase n=1 Tax=Cerasicoccus frondis TaxID=490090 RepID=UPI002852B564|nr:glutamate-5-semialdehyde dehydrogenase [Cerasicoccus frondis]
MSEETQDLKQLITGIAKQARAASLELAVLDASVKNQALGILAERIVAATDELLAANKKDLAAAEALELAKPMVERLTFTPERIQKMADGVKEVAALPDPVGEELEQIERPNGLDIRKVRVPIGVVGIIFESRPNVTIDCAVLCLKSGNAAILRGGKEAFHTNMALAKILAEALAEAGINPHAVQLIPTVDRWALTELLKLDQYVHCIIPRGGESLIRFVAENSRIPVIKHYTGVCSIYVDIDADADLAESIVINAKTQRVSVCNAIENLFIHREAAPDLLPRLTHALENKGVVLRVDQDSGRMLEKINAGGIAHGAPGIEFEYATEDDFYEEYLDYKIAIKLVDDVAEAVACINRYGSAHSDGIVTTNEATAKKFLQGVDSATVYWNASTRFTDGYEFGLGAEIGISTDRLHARGPMGLRELCTYKYLVFGTGQIK